MIFYFLTDDDDLIVIKSNNFLNKENENSEYYCTYALQRNAKFTHIENE